MAEIAVVIRPRLIAGRWRQVCAYNLSDQSLYNLQKFIHSQDRFWLDADEIHLRSLIGACTCTLVYTWIALFWCAKMLWKKCMCNKRVEVYHKHRSSAWLPRGLSGHRKSCNRKKSAQSNQKMVFKRITPAETFFVYLVLNDSGMRNWTAWRWYCFANHMIRDSLIR